jgi:ABC-type antimicrobial peptide transport system permease subunit
MQVGFCGQSWNGFVWINGAPAGNTLTFFLGVSPGWLAAMRIPLIDGRDLTTDDPKEVAIVNEALARTYFNGGDPIGRSFEKTQGAGQRIRFQSSGSFPTLYQDVREPYTPTVYVPFSTISASGTPRSATLVVRTTARDPMALASQLRREVPRVRQELRVNNIQTQVEIAVSQTWRERLLAMLAMFFGAVALLLTGLGLYGVLHDSVLQRRREIGIRRRSARVAAT